MAKESKSSTGLIAVVVLCLVLASCVVTPSEAPAAIRASVTPTPVPPTDTPVPPTPVPPTEMPSAAFKLATSAEEILGTWQVGAHALRFDEDGTCSHLGPYTRDDRPYAISEFTFDGTRMSLKQISVSNVDSCGSEVGTYEVRLLESGAIQIVAVNDKCADRAGDVAGVYESVREPARVEDLIGIWRHPGGIYLKLNEDGTYRLAEIVARLETLPNEFGRFELEGTTFTFITSNESPGCTGQTGSYQVELTEQGKLRYVSLQEDPCQWRADNAPIAWERVGPSLVPGTYATTITQEDTSYYKVIGMWELILAEDNRWIATYLGRSVAEGRYSLTPDQIVVTHEKGPYTDTCTNIGAETGTYKWAFDGGTLTLTTVEDECFNRKLVFTAHPWSKVELPQGTYVTTITQEDFLVRDDLGLVARSILLGEWEMTLTEGNGYSHNEVMESGPMVVAEEGHYTLTRDQMVFTAEGGAYACIGPQGIYQWALDGKTLTLTTVEDPCPERNTLNSAHPWTKQD